MRRYWRIYKSFFVSSFARELEFRANFFAKILQNLTWTIFFILILLVVFRNTNSVAGWSREQSFIIAGTCFLVNATSSGLFMSLMEIPEQVRQGTLDFVVTKPVDSQFWISCRRFNFDQVGTILAGTGLIIYGVVGSKLNPSFLDVIGFLLLVGVGTCIFYAFKLMLMTLGIWLVRVDNLWVVAETVIEVARFPIDIYGAALRQAMIFFVPLAFLATIPTRQLVTGFDFGYVLLGLAWAVVALLIARAFWRFAMRHYTSASS